jgi:hypothetical protein
MGADASRNQNPSRRTLEQKYEWIPMFLNVEKWKVLKYNVKLCASQNIWICVGTVEDTGMFGKSIEG